MTCIFCLQKAMVLKFDKNRKPYFKCDMCHQRVFMQGIVSLRAMIAISELLSELDKDSLREYFKKANVGLGSLYEKNSEIKSYVDSNSLNFEQLREVQNV
jgi:hypothetical protein